MTRTDAMDAIQKIAGMPKALAASVGALLGTALTIATVAFTFGNDRAIVLEKLNQIAKSVEALSSTDIQHEARLRSLESMAELVRINTGRIGKLEEIANIAINTNQRLATLESDRNSSMAEWRKWRESFQDDVSTRLARIETKLEKPK